MPGIREVADAINAYNSFVISAHVNPEGDAVGSQLGLGLSLMKMGKRVTFLSFDKVPDFLTFLPGSALVRQGDRIEEEHDALIVVDCEPGRTGLKDLDRAPVKKIINIDHHITNPETADVYWVNPDAAAAGEMVYDLLKLMGAPIDLAVATNLYTSIFTDTGSFRYTNTDYDALSKSAELLTYGVDAWQITENVYETKSFNRMKLLGLVLSTLEKSGDGGLAWVTVLEDFYRQTGTSAEDTDGFINYPRSVKDVEVAVLFREAGPDTVKISFRSKGRVDISTFAQALGGGGHPNAAGVVMKGITVDAARALVVPKMVEHIKKTLVA